MKRYARSHSSEDRRVVARFPKPLRELQSLGKTAAAQLLAPLRGSYSDDNFDSRSDGEGF